MSREQANTFKKHRDAVDPTGNLTWIARVQQKALRAGPEALARLDVEREFELSDEEKVLWRLIKLPRKVMDLDHAGVMPQEKLRGFLRGLVAADVVDIVDATEAKALIPAEIRRVKGEVTGAPAPQKPTQPLRAKVYRPDISKPGEGGAEQPMESPPVSNHDFQPPPTSNPTNRAGPASSASMRPPPVSGAGIKKPLSAEEQALKGQIERAYADMSKQNHYEFMGLNRPADDAGVKQAFVRLAREYHPDKLAGSGIAGEADLQVMVEALFRRLGDAQQALANAEARAGYDRTLDLLAAGGGQAADASGKQRRPAEAQNAYRMGDTFYKKRDFKQAEMHFRQAAIFDAEDPKILTALAWCIFSNTDHEEKQRMAEAKKRLFDVTQRHKFADAHYKLGLIMRKAGDEATAQKQIAMAAKLDPNHHEATREVRLADMRSGKDDKDDKGLLGKFLRK